MIQSKLLSAALACCAALLLFSGTASAQTTHIVTVSGFSFSPSTITIAEGDTVRWINLNPVHNVAQTDCPATSSSSYNGGFYSGAPGAVSSFEVTFNSLGEFCYICEPHAPSFDMYGTVVVAAPVPALSTYGVGALVVLLSVAGVLVLRARAA